MRPFRLRKSKKPKPELPRSDQVILSALMEQVQHEDERQYTARISFAGKRVNGVTQISGIEVCALKK